MAFVSYSGTINVIDGFGYDQVDIVTVGALNNLVAVDSAGMPMEPGTVMNIYDGAFELDALVPGSLMWQYQPLTLQYFGTQFLYSNVANTILTVAVKLPSKKRTVIYYYITIYR